MPESEAFCYTVGEKCRLASLQDAAEGLHIDGALNLDVIRAREAYSLLKQKALSGLSIGYVVPTDGWEPRKGGGRTLKSISLFEASLVAFPANDDARVNAVKSVTSVRDFERYLHNAGWSKKEAAAIASHGYKRGLEIVAEESGDEQALLTFLREQNTVRR